MNKEFSVRSCCVEEGCLECAVRCEGVAGGRLVAASRTFLEWARVCQKRGGGPGCLQCVVNTVRKRPSSPLPSLLEVSQR